jgi:hypothetical protein
MGAGPVKRQRQYRFLHPLDTESEIEMESGKLHFLRTLIARGLATTTRWKVAKDLYDLRAVSAEVSRFQQHLVT